MTAALVCGLTWTTTTTTRAGRAPDACEASRAPVLCDTHQLRRKVWRLQRIMGMPLSPTTFSDRRRHASRAYRGWVNDLWAGRLVRLERRHERWKRTEGDLLAYVNREWPRYENWVRIGVCESGQDPPNWQHNSGTYQGALGFYHGSWDQFNTFGFPSEAYLATPLQQMRVAEAIFERFALTGWGCRGAA